MSILCEQAISSSVHDRSANARPFRVSPSALPRQIKSDTFNLVKIGFNPAKREVTLRERGLDFADAEKVFAGRYTILKTERNGETRYISAGYLSGRMVVIVWTPREDARHIISMRHCHAKEEARWQKHLE